MSAIGDACTAGSISSNVFYLRPVQFISFAFGVYCVSVISSNSTHFLDIGCMFMRARVFSTASTPCRLSWNFCWKSWRYELHFSVSVYLCLCVCLLVCACMYVLAVLVAACH